MPEKHPTTADESNALELSTLSPAQMGWVSLTASVDVRELPEPVANHLAERAREIEREFQQKVGVPAETYPTHTATWPHERTKVGLEATVSVRGRSLKERREAQEIATRYERKFIEEVRETRAKYLD
jgi:hypothetical protein